jgi:hypothetical protein
VIAVNGLPLDRHHGAMPSMCAGNCWTVPGTC